MSPFSPSARFLLDLNWENLYEPARADELDKTIYRCKGCGEIVTRYQREKHYKTHRRVEEAKRLEEIRQARERGLAEARRARAERRAA